MTWLELNVYHERKLKPKEIAMLKGFLDGMALCDYWADEEEVTDEDRIMWKEFENKPI